MKNLLILFVSISLFSCSSEKKQMEIIRDMAQNDVQRLLELPEGTLFENKQIKISKSPNDEEDFGTTYVVKVRIHSEDKDGNMNIKTHILEYTKIGETGLSPDDYELKSFD